jgi:23S rRNA (adenine2503-C2)-methyltransferase
MSKIDIRSLELEEMEKFFLELGEKKYRALQVYTWINNKLVDSFENMTDLSKDLRTKLEEKAYFSSIECVDKVLSTDVKKYLFKLDNDDIVESVFMRKNYGNSICVSSQVGCRMACSFCASGVNGLERSLTPGEIAAQVYAIQKEIGERVTHIVLMGSGEPFDNYNNIMKFLKIINSPKGLAIGQRHITVSTSGILERIYDFADENIQVNLALSLHAPNDEIRKSLMPVAKRYTIDELLKACRYYTDKTKRRITYEYALISGFNDSEDNAYELSSRLKGTLCHVNLIPVNNVDENDYIPSAENSIEKFTNILLGYGIATTVRKTVGSDINAACGQLRKHYKENL